MGQQVGWFPGVGGVLPAGRQTFGEAVMLCTGQAFYPQHGPLVGHRNKGANGVDVHKHRGVVLGGTKNDPGTAGWAAPGLARTPWRS